MSRLVRTFAAVPAVAAALIASGCGWEPEHIVKSAHVEGLYLDVGELDYQVQISRILNPSVPPDDEYLEGVEDYVSPPDDDEAWFAVFMRVQNETDEPHKVAEEFKIVDTEGEEYHPVDVDPDANAYAYEPITLAPRDTYPTDDAAGATNSTQGQLILFKLPYEAMGNRPVRLVVEAEGDEGEIDLDL